MAKVSSLGHVGLFVNDLDAMRDFYVRVLGMTVTDESAERRMVFLSARPDEEHHELFLTTGRTGDPEVKVVQQVSFHADSVADVREFHRRFQEEGVAIDSVVTHGNTASVYFRDPEDNRLEVYYTLSVKGVKQPFRADIDVTRPDDDVLRQIEDAVAARG